MCVRSLSQGAEPEPEPEVVAAVVPSAQLQKEAIAALKAASSAEKAQKNAEDEDERRRLGVEAVGLYTQALELHSQLKPRDDVKPAVKETLADKMAKAELRRDKLQQGLAAVGPDRQDTGLPSASSSVDSDKHVAGSSFAAMQKQAVHALREAATADKARRGAAKDDKAQLTKEVIAQYRQAVELLRSVVSSPDCGGAAKSKMEEKISKATKRCEKLEEELISVTVNPELAPERAPDPEFPELSSDAEKQQPLFSASSGGAILTEEEFRQYDKDGSGEISFQEFSALVREKGWIYELSDTELQLAWQRIDTSGDGSISHSELQAWWSQGPGERFAGLKASDAERKQLEWAVRKFRAYDEDGNETLSRDEFVGLHAELVQSSLTALDVDRALAALDRDGDGEIHVSEFIHWLVDATSLDDEPVAAPNVNEDANDDEEGSSLPLPDTSDEAGDTELSSDGTAVVEEATTPDAALPSTLHAADQKLAAARVATPSSSSGSAFTSRLSPADRRAAFSASVQAKLAQRPGTSGEVSFTPFDLSLYTPRDIDGSTRNFRLSPASTSTSQAPMVGVSGRTVSSGMPNGRSSPQPMVAPMSATERAVARIRAEAAAVIKAEQDAEKARIDA